MKTSNKTNRRLLGVIVVMMVLILVTINVNAQKSYNENPLAVLGSEFFTNIKSVITDAISESTEKYETSDEETLEDWMMNPSEWKITEPVIKEDNFKEVEMILEDWMMKANWSNNSQMEEELQIEDWMTNPQTWNVAK
jgi:hypothetical protein